MKTIMVAAAVALLLAGGAWADSPAAEPWVREVRSVQRDVEDLTARLNKIESRLETIEARLGTTYRPPSPFDTMERRLDSIEKDVDDLKRRR